MFPLLLASSILWLCWMWLRTNSCHIYHATSKSFTEASIQTTVRSMMTNRGSTIPVPLVQLPFHSARISPGTVDRETGADKLPVEGRS